VASQRRWRDFTMRQWNGRLQGPLVKGAGFRDCASKRGRLGDFCCGWRGLTVRRWGRNPSGFCLRQNPPPFTREAWVVSQCRWRDFTMRQWERQSPRPPCKGGLASAIAQANAEDWGIPAAGGETSPCGGGVGIPPAFACGKTHLPLQGRLGVASQRRWRGFTARRWERQAPRPPCKGGWLPRLREQTRKTGGFLLRVERFYRAAVGNGIPPSFACGKTHLPLQGRLGVASQRR